MYVYRLRTLNLNSPTGGRAYGIPRKFATSRSRTVLLHLPWTKPHFVLTRSCSVSTNKPSARTSVDTRTHMHRQILTFNRRSSVDMVQETHVLSRIYREGPCAVGVRKLTEIQHNFICTTTGCVYREPSHDTNRIRLIMKVMIQQWSRAKRLYSIV